MKYSESEEMYLETILILENHTPNVRSVDIANELGYSKASISVAMKRLKEKGYIAMGDSAAICLTEKGRQTAMRVYERHHLLTQFFTSIGADSMVAEENACRIEHVISPELVEIIRGHLHTEPQTV